MVLDDLLAGTDDLADFAVRQTFPDRNRDLDLLRGGARRVSGLSLLPGEHGNGQFHARAALA